ncbi:OpgC domain-containing protein [Serratia sp. DD3]|uniref:OpgC domain-containing protein n=1 Tax=Serratia sp. DD3 TaxID=1410619 RepID=UPI0004D93202|nr:OpgC domain-containing protein [Serratia sp. DD3]KEY57545.1 putative membrane protein [Serratia sp. DD3]
MSLSAGLSIKGMSLAYHASPQAAGKRDLRIDFLRGIALIMMVAAHIEITSVVNIFTWERFGLTTGAEGFVILSGFVLGFLKKQQLERDHFLTVAYSILRRAVTLYFINITIILSILVLTKIGVNTYETTHFVERFSGTAYSMYPTDGGSLESWLNNILFLQIGPHQTQILGLYFYLLLITPVMFYLLYHKKALLLLGVSLTLYIIYQNNRIILTSAQFEFAFPLLSWQLIYVLGLCCGWYKDELMSLAKNNFGVFVIGLLIVIFFILLFIAQNRLNPFLPKSFFLHIIPINQVNWMYDNLAAKNALGPLRVLNDIALLVTMYVFLSYFWRPMNYLFSWFLVPLGQNSLYTFILHVYIVLIASFFVKFNLLEYHWLRNTLVHCASLLFLWWLAKSQVLRRFVPN